ncbi:uncharacterized protein IUM83_17596 [Phytophthora cinnamomi]|uniref:uncharacterized protein n=1 Tax=Phytophthora cinnamomi TaxID=4785 RepID=UPI00355A2A97|nr:hypothetical protein IUM83_17596 [Phytophthora cinnamomi]
MTTAVAPDAEFLEISMLLDANDVVGTIPSIQETEGNVSGHPVVVQPAAVSPGRINSTDAQALRHLHDETSANEKEATKRLTRRQKEVRRKQRYQQRLKNERETLRRLERELTTRLTHLQQEYRHKRNDTATNVVVVNSIWRDLAIMQREHLDQAKAKQKNLVAAASMQASYIATLRSLVPENVLGMAAVKQEISFAMASSLQMNKQADRALFAEHLRQVVADYDQVEEIFREFDVLGMPNGMTRSMRKPTTGNGGEYFQHFNRFTQPFPLHQTQQSWWTLASFQDVIKDREDYTDLADPSKATILRLHVVRTLVTGAAVSFIQRYIFRRVVGKSSAVFTWKTYSEGEGFFAGMHMEETGWARLQEIPEDEMTVVGVCVHQTPVHFGSATPRKGSDHEFCETMHDLLHENAKVITQMLTKMLVGETLSDIDI